MKTWGTLVNKKLKEQRKKSLRKQKDKLLSMMLIKVLLIFKTK